MAVYIPPNVWEKAVEICRIIKSEDKDGFTNYAIEVRIPPFKWQVMRRYRQFVELHEKMIKNFSVNKNLLPPKKLLALFLDFQKYEIRAMTSVLSEILFNEEPGSMQQLGVSSGFYANNKSDG
ncbi:hypothetical protein TNCV_113631 [Trichonephila clavipes]|nr:hypothetical protein TNCV_113631 [Trichonephila clavipes]